MMADKLLDALDSVVWYNNYAGDLFIIRKEINSLEINDSCAIYQYSKYWETDDFNIIWMVLVILFGNYGSSPRTGWLEVTNKNKADIIEFIDNITITTRSVVTDA